jgi:hypothetical protein
VRLVDTSVFNAWRSLSLVPSNQGPYLDNEPAKAKFKGLMPDHAVVLSGIPPMNPKPGWIFTDFYAVRQDLLAARTAAVILAPRTAAEGLIWAIFAGIWTHSSLRLLLNA